MRSIEQQSNVVPPSERPTPRQKIIQQLGPWFHNLHLPDGEQTAPHHVLGDFPRFKWEQIAPAVPDNLTGWRALDIGCNAGFYCIELARRGAQVLGIDHQRHYLDQARWAVAEFGLEEQVSLRQMQIYELVRLDEVFDLVLFLGVFYHLRYPLLALDIVTEKVRRLMAFQTLTLPGPTESPPTDDRPIHERQALTEAGWPKMAFIEGRFAGDANNWWLANPTGVEAMLRSSGMRITRRLPEAETWICEPAANPTQAARSWDQTTLLAATGRSS